MPANLGSNFTCGYSALDRGSFQEAGRLPRGARTGRGITDNRENPGLYRTTGVQQAGLCGCTQQLGQMAQEIGRSLEIAALRAWRR